MRFENLSDIMKGSSKSFYVFDIEKLHQRIDYIKEKLPNHLEFCYAVKANTFITEFIIDKVERFEICSPGEAKICKLQGVPYSKMVISGVYKDPYFIRELVNDKDFDGIFTIESMGQFELIKKYVDEYKRKVNLLLRLTNDSQFGMDISDIEEIVEQRNDEFINLLGIQYFTGTQKHSLKKFARELRTLEDLLADLKEKFDYIPHEIEYGTGFPVAYFENEEIDEENLFSEWSRLIENFSYKGKITIELGRSVVASCGSYFTHIVDIKTNKSQNYLMVDGGMHQIMYFGQYMAMKLPFIRHIKMEKGDVVKGKHLYNIAGSLCTMNDILVKQAEFEDISVGDVLEFQNAGAYSMTEGMSLFLSRDIPAIYVKIKENSNVVFERLRDNFETYKLNMRNK
ncbi:diaminopimelate decarboxylase family protein [Helcococcus kunzii]